VAISTLDQVGKDRGKVRPCRASLLRIDRELTYATRQPTSLIEVLPRILPARSFAGVQPDADQMFCSCTYQLCNFKY
jgi:hypothetical protein